MEAIVGAPPWTFGINTLGLMGFAAFMTGQAQANAWRPMWQIIPYAIMLGIADRFFSWGLGDGDGLSITGWIIDTLYLFAVCVGAYRMTLARKMATQYPWLYERTGPFTWRKRIQPFRAPQRST